MPKALRSSTRTGASRADPVSRPRRSTRNPEPTHKPSTTNRRKPKVPPLPLYTRTRDGINADPNRKLGLFRLPRELLKDITTSYLGLEEAVCLTLTCKDALGTIGSWPWQDFKKLHRWDPSRTKLFDLLTRDWGKEVWEFCTRCNTMHPWLPPPRKHKKTALTMYCFGQDACVDYFPRNEEGYGYSLVFQHILSALKQPPPKKGMSGPPIPNLTGDYMVEYPKFGYRLESSARRIGDNLVMKHVHTFQATSSNSSSSRKKPEPLSAKDLLELPIRLCPHQSTITTGPKEKSRYIKSEEKNSPQLTQAIITAFPASQRAAAPNTTSVFSKPRPTELKDMEAADRGEDVVWRCRCCPTNYCVGFSSASSSSASSSSASSSSASSSTKSTLDSLVITSCHYFGKDLLHAQKYFKWMVRREGTLLGKDKRNDEWWSAGRSVPDFRVE